MPPGTSSATLAGGLDFSAVAPFLGSLGIEEPLGRLDIDLAIGGVVSQPTVTGYVRIPEDKPIELDLTDDDVDERGRHRTRPIPLPAHWRAHTGVCAAPTTCGGTAPPNLL